MSAGRGQVVDQPGNAGDTQQRRPGCLIRGVGVVLGWHVLLVAAYLLWAFLQPAQHSPDSCDGIGWGCTPNPRDGALIIGIVYGANPSDMADLDSQARSTREGGAGGDR